MGHFICNSCSAQIPPEWVHAIQLNVCPGCGGQIMDEQTTTLLKGLSEAMEKMPNDPQGIAGWILANYRLEKVGDGEPTGFHRIKPQESVASAAGGFSNDRQTKLNEFFKRAEAPANVIGQTREELKKKIDEENSDVTVDEPEENVIDVKDNMKDPKFANVNVADVLNEEEIERIRAKAASRKRIPSPIKPATVDQDALEYSEMPENISPALRAELERTITNQQSARNNVSSGIRLNKNGFTRSD